MQFSDAYRQYNPELPAFLRNRPRDFVQHVCKRWTSADDIPASSVRQTSDVDFAVTSADSGSEYTVHLGRANDMPHCQCYDWAHSHWPCKHMLSIFRRTSYTWDDLCPLYRDSPFFCIDSELFDMEPSYTVAGAEEAVDVAAVDSDSEQYTEPPSASEPSVTAVAARCRERLRWLQDATYLCTDHSALSHLESELHSSSSRLSTFLPRDSGITLQPGAIPKRKRSLKNVRRAKASQGASASTEQQPTTSEHQFPTAAAAEDKSATAADTAMPKQRGALPKRKRSSKNVRRAKESSSTAEQPMTSDHQFPTAAATAATPTETTGTTCINN